MIEDKPKIITAFMARRDARNEAGKCANCSRPPMIDRSYCSVCAAAHRRGIDKTREARKAKGLCVECGKQSPVEGKVRCIGCAHAASVRAAAWVKKKREREKAARNNSRRASE